MADKETIPRTSEEDPELLVTIRNETPYRLKVKTDRIDETHATTVVITIQEDILQ